MGANLWRTTGDITPDWDRIYAIVSQQAGLEKYAGPGHWNDPDMLEVGNGKLTLAENRTHFSMWAMLAAPLLAGNDLPNMKPEIKAILTNRDVIAIDQDRLGKQGSARLLRRRGRGLDAASGRRRGGHRRSQCRRQPLLHPSLPPESAQTRLGSATQTGKDLWTGKTVKLTENMPLELASHDVLLVRIDKPKPSSPE